MPCCFHLITSLGNHVHLHRSYCSSHVKNEHDHVWKHVHTWYILYKNMSISHMRNFFTLGLFHEEINNNSFLFSAVLPDLPTWFLSILLFFMHICDIKTLLLLKWWIKSKWGLMGQKWRLVSDVRFHFFFFLCLFVFVFLIFFSVWTAENPFLCK